MERLALLRDFWNLTTFYVDTQTSSFSSQMQRFTGASEKIFSSSDPNASFWPSKFENFKKSNNGLQKPTKISRLDWKTSFFRIPHSFYRVIRKEFRGKAVKIRERKKTKNRPFFDRKLAVRDSDEERFFFSSDSLQNSEFSEKRIWTFFGVEFAMFFRFFREPKMKFRNQPLKWEKRSQNRNLMAENDSRRLNTVGGFSVSSKINYVSRGEVGGTRGR
jgi:hypothetical protein